MTLAGGRRFAAAALAAAGNTCDRSMVLLVTGPAIGPTVAVGGSGGSASPAPAAVDGVVVDGAVAGGDVDGAGPDRAFAAAPAGP